jgi:hypothetical protein
MDNDCDNLVDCDDPDCPHACQGGTADGQECASAAGLAACTDGGGICRCPPIQKDPTLIKFGRTPGMDRLTSHGRITIPGAVDVLGSEVGWALSNGAGLIWTDSLPAGTLTANNRLTVFNYKNLAARQTGGIARVTIRITHHGLLYGYKVEAYGDMSKANDPNMSIQFYVGNQSTAAIHREAWKKIPGGWKATGFLNR